MRVKIQVVREASGAGRGGVREAMTVMDSRTTAAVLGITRTTLQRSLVGDCVCDEAGLEGEEWDGESVEVDVEVVVLLADDSRSSSVWP